MKRTRHLFCSVVMPLLAMTVSLNANPYDDSYYNPAFTDDEMPAMTQYDYPDEMSPQYGYPDGAMPQYGYPNEMMPQYGYPDGAMPQYGYPDGAMPQYSYPDEMMPQYNYPGEAAPQYDYAEKQPASKKASFDNKVSTTSQKTDSPDKTATTEQQQQQQKPQQQQQSQQQQQTSKQPPKGPCDDKKSGADSKGAPSSKPWVEADPYYYNATCGVNSDPLIPKGFGLAVRAGAFFPFTKELKSVWSTWDIELVTPCRGSNLCCLQPWLSISFMRNHNSSKEHSHDTHHTHHRSKRRSHDKREPVSITPLCFGLKFFPMMPMVPLPLKSYLGMGINYSFMSLRDRSHSCPHRHDEDKGAWGLTVKGGGYYEYSDCFSVDLFIDYYYTRFNFNKCKCHFKQFHRTRCLDVNGLKVGAGILYSF